jgi:putative hydrolase of HD superfamily
MSRLSQQIDFILEIDKLKSIYRQSLLLDQTRKENSAEHSWHVTCMVMLLEEYANESIDIVRIMKMLLLHDVIEIDAGDTYFYDPVASADKEEREQKAADRLFAILPEGQGAEYRAIWDEFEAVETPEGKFAKALDRLMPLLHNFHTGGKSWQEHGVTEQQVREQIIPDILPGSKELAKLASEVIDNAVKKGFLKTEY